MVKRLLVLLLFCSSFSYAETIKTDVLVIGGTPSGATAAIQCARSKVKTMLIMPAGWLEPGMPAGVSYFITSNHNLPSGIWGEFRDRAIRFYSFSTGYDDKILDLSLKFEYATGMSILKQIADTVKNLTIRQNTTFITIKKDGTGWEVSVTQNGLTDIIKAKVVIDATEKGEVVNRASATLPPVFDIKKGNSGELYRTSIAVGDVWPRMVGNGRSEIDYQSIQDYCVPMRDVIVKDADNLLVTEKILPANGNIQYLPLQMCLGQGAGTVAAYLAFFKTTTKNLKVRIIQQELLDFKGYLMPFTDIKKDDKYIRAIQQIGATGMLKGVQKLGGLFFNSDSVVTTDEIKPILTEVYSRAFLWFNKEKPGEKFTEGNLLSLISEMTLSEPKTLQITMQRDWKTKYQFNSDLDLTRPVTRLEFAVLINQFLNPFARTVDMAGNIVN